MELTRKSISRSAQEQEEMRQRVLNVGLPSPYEGVGNALRSTFRARRDVLPDDMLDLLGQLDRH